MSEKRDFIDVIIDIQSDWQALSNPLGGVVDALTEDPAKRKTFKADNYKERPRINSARCLRCTSGGKDVCSECLDVCPTDSIEIGEKAVKIDSSCRKCLLCLAVCPTEVFLAQKMNQQTIYDRCARAASAYEQCYVTCTRAMARLGRLPKGNEVVLPCVGAMTPDLWFSLLVDYVNISVFLPDGICERCRTTTGEDTYSDAIAKAEEWSNTSVGLETQEADLTHELTRAYKRSQFISGALSAGERLVMRTNPVLAGAQAIKNKIESHTEQLSRLQKEIETAVGTTTAQNRQRYVTNRRKLMMAALQHDPDLACFVNLEVPVLDPYLCTGCGECVAVCAPHAIEQQNNGRIRIEAINCVNCAACALICPEEALSIQRLDARELVIVDEESERIAAERAQARAKAKKEAKLLIEEGKKKLQEVGSALEALDDKSKE